MNSEIWDREYSRTDVVWKGPPLQENPFPPGSDILELGCGNGKNLPQFLKTAASLTAADFSKNAIELCRRRFSDSKISFVEADACKLPFQDESFDAVSAIHLLEHLTYAERLKSVSEMERILKINGMVMVRVFSVDDMRYGKGTEIEKNTFCRGNGIVYHYFTKDELISLFSNFKLIECTLLFESKKYGTRSEICALLSKVIL